MKNIKMAYLTPTEIIYSFFLLSAILQYSQGFSSRIIGGFEVPIGFANYHASLQNLAGHHVCGGALISENSVVTAAHCLVGVATEYVKIVVGTTHLDYSGTEYEVNSILIHEGYNETSKVHDIAIIKTKTAVNLDDQVRIIELYEGDLEESDQLILTGFGALEAKGDSSRNLHVLEVQVFSQETCQFAMRYTREVYNSMFCTFNRIGEGTCHGDSGGPLEKDGKLVGLVSWGIPCAVGFPDVHTRIKPYISWLKEHSL